MEAGTNAGGDVTTPYSKFVDKKKLGTDWKARPASPSTVTNVAVLPQGQTKKNIKSFLKERLFLPDNDIRSVLFKSLVKRIPHNTSMFSQQMFSDFITECCPKIFSLIDAPLPSFVPNEEDIPSYILNVEGQIELRKILLCINHCFPHVVYCPLLPSVVALFLHYDDSPSQVFMHVCHLLFCSLRHIHYLDQNKSETEASTQVLTELVRRYAPTSHKTLVNFAANPNEIYSQWIRVLFNGLPLPYLVIVFDMYLIEGYKALFRAAISVLKFYKKVGSSNPSDIPSAVFEFVSTIDSKVSTTLLFKKAYSVKLPTSKEIRKLHHKHLGIVRQFPPTETASKSTLSERSAWRYIYFVRNCVSDIADETLFSKLYCWLPERITTLRPSLLFSTSKDGYSMDSLFRAADERTPSLLLIKTTGSAIFGGYLTSDWSERHTSPKSYFGTGETFLFTLSPEQKKFEWVGISTSQKLDSQSNSSIIDDRNSLCSSGKSSLGPVAAMSSRGITLPPIHREGLSLSVASSNHDSRESSVVLPPLVSSPTSQQASPSMSLSNVTESPSLPKTEQKEKFKSSSELFMFADENGVVIGGGNGCGLFLDTSFLNCYTQHCDTFDNEPLVPGGTFQCSHVELFGFVE